MTFTPVFHNLLQCERSNNCASSLPESSLFFV